MHYEIGLKIIKLQNQRERKKEKKSSKSYQMLDVEENARIVGMPLA